ncbi:MAG: hypothetical protein HQ503_00835 [Rhodospirillales bacterium]|nr:hypothetical protein [Rhodospirillales bacterium]
MDQGIRAVWYDLEENDKGEYLAWLHGKYLPQILARPGILWAAHYEITGGGGEMDKVGEILARAEEDIGHGTDYLLLIGAGSPHVFFKPDWDKGEQEDEDVRQMISRRSGARTAVFTEEARVNGPDFDARTFDTTPGPAIQMGSFRTKTVEDEFDLAAWYANYRMPAMARMAGCIATRKLVSVAGWAKHSVLYEFLSLEARAENFQKHESLALDETVWTNKIINYTIHAPGSPSVGHRIWPDVTNS